MDLVHMLNYPVHGAVIVNSDIIKAIDLIAHGDGRDTGFPYALGHLLADIIHGNIRYVQNDTVKIFKIRKLINVVFTDIVILVPAPIAESKQGRS